jgi:hypothetical protein
MAQRLGTNCQTTARAAIFFLLDHVHGQLGWNHVQTAHHVLVENFDRLVGSNHFFGYTRESTHVWITTRDIWHEFASNSTSYKRLRCAGTGAC